MALIHSNENLPALVENSIDNNKRQCSICKKDYEIDDIVVSTPCNHVFHKDCVVEVLKETQACPICSKACRHTKLKSHNILAEAENQGASVPIPSNNSVNSRGAIPKVRKNPRRNILDETSRTPALNRSNARDNNNLLDISQTNSQNLPTNVDANSISDTSLQFLVNEAVRTQLASLNINSNFKPSNQFEKAKIVKKIGSCYYELEDMNGKVLGKFHAKDIKS